MLSRRDRGRYSIVPDQTTHPTGAMVFGGPNASEADLANVVAYLKQQARQ